MFLTGASIRHPAWRRRFAAAATFAAFMLVGAGISFLPVASATAAEMAKAATKATVKPTGDDARLGAAIRAYLLANPEVVREAMAALQQREAAAEAESRRQALSMNRDALIADADAPVLGNPDGDVTVVEFFDYRCGYCKRVAPTVAALLAGDRKVRVIMKELPILGADSLLAAKSALAARKQGRYEAFHDALFNAAQVDEAAIAAIAASLGLDMDKFRADRDDAAVAAMLDRNHALAAALGINGTPAFIVGDQLIPGAVDANTLASLVHTARQGHKAATKK